MIFADSDRGGGFGFIIFIIIMVVGARQWIIWIKGNDAVRGAAKKGLFHVLGNLFKK